MVYTYILEGPIWQAAAIYLVIFYRHFIFHNQAVSPTENSVCASPREAKLIKPAHVRKLAI